MATKISPPSSERSRVRFIMVDFDGTSSDLHQLAQTFASAVKAPQQNIVMLPPPAYSIGSPPAIEQAPPQNGTNGVHGDEHEHVEDVSVMPSPANKPQNGTTKKKYKTPSIISDLEFTSGTKPFKTYWQEQAPEEQSKRYLVCLQWLKKYRGISEVGADHIYTCFRAVNLNVPADVLSILRALKQQGWVEKGSKPGLFKITHIGENQLKQLTE